jgi:hypothetical protein
LSSSLARASRVVARARVARPRASSRGQPRVVRRRVVARGRRVARPSVAADGRRATHRRVALETRDIAASARRGVVCDRAPPPAVGESDAASAVFAVMGVCVVII